MTEDDVTRADAEALLETRRDLGLRYDTELVDGFADRVERAVESRASERSAQRDLDRRHQAAAGGRQVALGVVSVVALIPISIVLGLNGALVALLLVVTGIVTVNVAHAWLSRTSGP